MADLILLDDYFRDFNTKADRRIQFKDQFTPQILQNATKLLSIINPFLNELGIKSAQVSSGWRPPTINQATPNAAKNSGHMSGNACDIFDDKDQTLGKLIASNPDLLRKYSLFLEDLNSTRGRATNWVHLDCLNRVDRPSRVFKP